jgi:hypothetical protein
MTSLTNSDLLTSDMISYVQKIHSLIHDSHTHFHRKFYKHLLVKWPPCSIFPVLPLYLTYVLLFVMQLLWHNLPYRPLIFCVTGPIYIGSLSLFQWKEIVLIQHWDECVIIHCRVQWKKKSMIGK